MDNSELFPATFLRQLEALEAALMRLRGSVGEGIARHGRAQGQSEFKGHRPYARGDDLRRLDWNAYGRLGKLFLREFEPERAEVLTLLVDTSRSMAAGNPAKHLLARRVAAAFGYLALKHGAGAEVAGNALLQGPARFHRLLDELAMLEFTEGVGLGDATRALSARPRTPANLVVVSDGLEPLEAFAPLATLSGRRCSVTLVQVLAPDEVNPPLIGEVSLRGLEDSAALALTLDAATVAAYRAELAVHLDAIGAIALRHGWTYAVAESDADVRGLMLDGLLSAGAAR